MLKSLVWLLIVIADLWAIYQVLKSTASTVEKLLWILLIVILPILGLLIWYFAGPGNKKI